MPPDGGSKSLTSSLPATVVLIGAFSPQPSRVGNSTRQRRRVQRDSLQPAGDDNLLEYVELYNQLAVNVDISNWRIGGIGYNFPERTVLPGGSYLVVAKDPAALQAATGYAGALGPFEGLLSNSGETLRLFSQRHAFRTSRDAGPRGEVTDSLEGRRIMDELAFADVYPWPSGPDGSGSTLAKIDPTTGTSSPPTGA